MSNTVVVVGHGLTPEGKGWGSKIDACDVVIRMWNWAPWQNAHDYGVRYDYGFYEISPTEMNRLYTHNCRTPKYGWVATRLRKPFEGELLPDTEVVDSSRWEREAMAMGGLGLKGNLILTRGVRMAAWAMERLSVGDRMVLVGFDNVYTGRTLSSKEGFPQVFIDCPAGYPMHRYDSAVQTATKLGNHDYAVEGPFLAKVAARTGVDLVHAQDCW